MGITERVSGVIAGWTVRSECQNAVEVDVASAEEDRKGHIEKWEEEEEEEETCGVSVGGNLQIRLSTLFWGCLCLVWICLISLCKVTKRRSHSQTDTQATLFALLIFTTLNTSFQRSLLNPECVSLCVCVSVPSLNAHSLPPTLEVVSRQTGMTSLPCSRANNKWSFVLLCECTAQRQIQWKQLLTSLNNHFSFSKTALHFSNVDWLTASVKCLL